MRVHDIGSTGTILMLPVYSRFSGSSFFVDGIETVLIHPLNRSRSVFHTKGMITDHAKNLGEERPCTNLQLKGDVTLFSSITMRASRGPYRFALDSIPVQTNFVTYRTNDRTSKSRSCDIIIDRDHAPTGETSYPDYFEPNLVRRYRNIKVVLSHEGWVFRRVVSYEYSYRMGPWQPLVQSSYFEFRPDSLTYRTSPTTTRWQDATKFTLHNANLPKPHLVESSFPDSWGEYSRLTSRIGRFYTFPNPEWVYGDLVRRCANDARVVQTNGIELAAELRVILQSVKEAIYLGMKTVSPAVLGGAYLSYKYGLRLTAIGVKSLTDDIFRELYRRHERDNVSRARAREKFLLQSSTSDYGDCLVEFNYKMIHSRRSGDWRDPLRTWFDSGMFPSLTNAWDLIPLTFVFDWFYRMEDHLNAWDANTYWSLYDIHGVVYSEKRTYRDVTHLFSRAGYTLVGQCTFVDYRRYTSRYAHKPLFFDPHPRIFKNYAELTALLVANSK